MAEVDLNLEELEGLLVNGSTLPPDTRIDVRGLPTESAESAFPDPEEVATKRKSKKNKKHRYEEQSNVLNTDDYEWKKSKYVLDAAESTDNDADEFVEENDEVEEGLDDGPFYEAPKRFIFHEGDEAKSADELGREFEERYQRLKKQKSIENLQGVIPREKMSSLRFASYLLPQNSDPKVFAVKCRPRMARILVTRIVNKCYAYRVGRNYENKKVDLGIISVFCIDHVKEYIYIEAYRKIFVESALNGLEGIFRYNIAVVEPTQLLQMMERRSLNEKIRVGSFVRLRQRFYRMDLAQVTSVHQDGVHIDCKVVPREDFDGKPFSKVSAPLPPQFFVASRAMGVEDRGDHYRWGDLRFDKDGYLIKTLSSRMVIAEPQMEKPTAEELAHFFNNNRERVREALSHTDVSLTVHQIGDSVRVASGQLRNTIGTIVDIFTNDNTALLSCVAPSQKEPIKVRVELASCVKHFAEGSHVVVKAGDYAGESGTVVKSWDDVVLLFIDRLSSVTEIKVSANDCHQSKLTQMLKHSFGGWKLFDLVSIAEANTVACIVGLTRNDVVVITERNEVQNLTYAQIKAITIRGVCQTTDFMLNVLVPGSEVTIQRSAFTPFNLGGETARIKQVYNRTVFVCCQSIRENAGVVALSASCVLLIGGRTTTKQAAPPKQLPMPNRRAHNAKKVDISIPSNPISADWQINSEWCE
ncbi:unnamed protein product [Phytomonas sp. EM1]|nr:unnamed protein product [Phytomonas sp. EM1]|eukprot:CCW63615.1 unnamed protein product [Phytomonas sp. isolate EM1]